MDGFNRNKRNGDGRRTECRECQRVDGVAYGAAHRKERRAYGAAWRAANPNYFTEWHAANREHRAEYRQANPHIGWEHTYRSRARHFGHDPIVETFTREQLIDRYGDQCFHCGGEFEELDHYPIPISRGGHHTIDNCKPSCKPCNQKSWKEEERTAPSARATGAPSQGTRNR